MLLPQAEKAVWPKEVFFLLLRNPTVPIVTEPVGHWASEEPVYSGVLKTSIRLENMSKFSEFLAVSFF